MLLAFAFTSPASSTKMYRHELNLEVVYEFACAVSLRPVLVDGSNVVDIRLGKWKKEVYDKPKDLFS